MKFIVYFKSDKTVGELLHSDVIFDDSFQFRTFDSWCKNNVRGPIRAMGVIKPKILPILILQAIENDSENVYEVLKMLAKYKMEKKLKGSRLADLVPKPICSTSTRTRFIPLSQITTDGELSSMESDFDIQSGLKAFPPINKKKTEHKLPFQRPNSHCIDVPHTVVENFVNPSPSTSLSETSINNSVVQTLITTLAHINVGQENLEKRMKEVERQNEEILSLLKMKHIATSVDNKTTAIEFSTIDTMDCLGGMKHKCILICDLQFK
jgi:hypothetical protein